MRSGWLRGCRGRDILTGFSIFSRLLTGWVSSAVFNLDWMDYIILFAFQYSLVLWALAILYVRSSGLG